MFYFSSGDRTTNSQRYQQATVFVFSSERAGFAAKRLIQCLCHINICVTVNAVWDNLDNKYVPSFACFYRPEVAHFMPCETFFLNCYGAQGQFLFFNFLACGKMFQLNFLLTHSLARSSLLTFGRMLCVAYIFVLFSVCYYI